MLTGAPKTYLLGEFRLEADKLLLTHQQRPVHLARRPFLVLLYLIEHRDQVVSRAELLDRFWDGKDVYDDALRKCVGSIRKALGDSSDDPCFIETRYSAGYRFIGPVNEDNFASDETVMEIETRRGFKIVVETETSDDSTVADTNALTPAGITRVLRPAVARAGSLNQGTSARTSSLRYLRSKAAVALILAGLVIAAAIAAPGILHSRSAYSSSGVPGTINSIAVLPLKNLTGDAEQDYFSDGLTESLITRLSKTKNLTVVSRSSAFAFRDRAAKPDQASRLLGVQAVLEGSVRRSGDMVHVDVRLVNAEDGRVLWSSDNYDRRLKDIFVVQDEIACDVATRLHLQPCDSAIPAKRDTDNPAAYEAYLKGRYFWNKRTGEGVKKAISYFNQAVSLDPNYALAYSGLADCYFLGMWVVPFDSNEARTKAKAAALKTLALDENLANAHAAMAGIYFYEWSWTKAEQEHQRALALDPGSAELHHQYSLYLNVMKRPDDAIRESRRARELDPLSLPINTDLGMAYYYARRYDEAIAAYKQSLDMEPGFEEAHYYLGEAYMLKGAYPEAFAEYQKTSDASHGRAFHLIDVGWAYAYSGQIDNARTTLDQLIKLSKQEYVSPYYIASLYAAMGEKEQSLKWLDQAYSAHAPQLVDLLIDQSFDSVRADAHFKNLVYRVGLIR